MFLFRYDAKTEPFRIRDAADIEKSFRAPCSLVLVTPGSGEIGGEDDYVVLHRFGRHAAAASAPVIVADAILKYRQTIYMTGDCWHFAMALKRLYEDRGLEIIAFRRPGQEGVDHVAGRFPDGTIVDALGVFPDLETHAAAAKAFYVAWRRGVKVEAWETPETIEVAEIVRMLDRADEDDGWELKTAWNDPEKYAFAAETEDLIRICYGAEIERAVARPRMRI